ncbi:MAG: alpha-2-macroglobulin family protein [Bacteroidia bacterium]
MRYIIATLALLVAVLWGCNSNLVRVTKFTPTGEVSDFQTFTVTFNKDIAPKDKIDQWTNEEYMTFEPNIKGKYKWVSSNTLIFSPDRPLEPERNYNISFNDQRIMQNAPTDTRPRLGSYTFNTPDFAVKSADIFWKPIPKAEHRLSVQANLLFSYDVNPKEIKQYLEVTCNGKEVKNYTVVSEKPADIIAINFGEMEQNKEEQEFKITVKKGLNSIIKRNPLAKDKFFKIELPSIQRLAIGDTKAQLDDDNFVVDIITTQEVDKDKVDDFVVISPKVEGLKIKVSENTIKVTGKYPIGKELTLTVKKGLPGLYGGILENEYEDNVYFADVEPNLHFVDRKGKYLVRGGLENIKLEAINIEQAEVEVFEVFKNNMIFFFANNYSYDRYRHDDSYEYDYEDGEDYSNLETYGKSVYQKEITFRSIKNVRQPATVNLHDVINNRYKGIYVVQIRSDKDYWMRDAKIVAISDIGLIAKYSGSELLVFANSISTTQSLSNVTVSVISSNNQTLSTAVTDAQGVARFPNFANETNGFVPRLITADKDDDFNFLDLKMTNIETSRFDVGGKIVKADFYDTYMYADRNIFRPGETANVSGIVRDANFGVVKDLPVVIKVISPTGRIVNTFQKTLNEQGSYEVAIDFPESAQTGQYTAETYTANDKLMDSYRFYVEEFAPDKIRVNVKADKEVYELGDSVLVDVESEYLFGAPASNHKFEMDVRMNHASYESKAFAKHNFSKYSNNNTSIDNESSVGELDAVGKGKKGFFIKEELQSGGYLEGRAFVSVFDLTGRTVNRGVDFKVYPQNYFLGIQKKGYYYGVNKPITWNLVAVNPQDKPIAGFDATVELIRYEWKTVLEKNENNKYSYKSVEKEVVEWEKEVDFANGTKDFTFEAPVSGRYQVRVHKRGEDNYVHEDFYAYSWGNATASSFEVNKEGQVDMVANKEKYQPGETAKILFSTPFSGKMLVTIEREKVLKYYYVNVEKNSTELSIPIEDSFLPNFYVSATLFKAHTYENQQASGVPFLVGHGYLPITVEKPSTKLPVSIIAPEKIKPRTTQSITVKTTPNKDIFVTLAAVDEGILQVKDFQSPNPHAYMYGKRALDVKSSDMYELLLPEYQKIESSVAGGDDYNSSKRQNPMKSKRFKLVSKWSGIQRTDANGEVKVSFEIPQYNGELRLMAVAYQGANFGSAEKPMKVADDVILMPSVPRSLTLGDSIDIPVAVSNTTEKTGNATVTMSVEGPLKIIGEKSQTVKLEANGTGMLKFGLSAKDDVGLGKIRFVSTGLSGTEEEIEIDVHPAAAFTTEGNSGELKAGETEEITMPNDYVNGTQNGTITISKFPAAKFSKNLRDLIGYPHGCVEQTTSKLFPQLYYNELAAAVSPATYKKGQSPAYYVKEGIHKLEGMMDYEGKFSYWPGGEGDYNWWASAYATHFLIEAKKAGYEVNQEAITRALNYLSRKANEKSSEDYVTYLPTGRKIVSIAPKAALYSTYLLSLAGKPDQSLMNYYRARPDLLTGDTRYFLAGAYALAKNWNAYNEVLPKTFAPERTDASDNDNFDSEIRANAVMLNVLMDVDPTNAQVPLITKYLAGKMDIAYSTQENAWAFLALGKAAGKVADSKVKVEILVDGKPYKTIEDATASVSSDAFNGKKVSLRATGKGMTYYYWSSEGVKKSGNVKEEDKEIAIRRTYLDRKGVPILTNTFAQGQLVVCKIELQGGQRSVKRIAISDLVPSGFEIDNPRLRPTTELSWIRDAANKFEPEYMDIRDDRLILFTDINAKETKTYYYMLRVINIGKFQLPAITAESMYEAAVHSSNGAKTLIVKG